MNTLQKSRFLIIGISLLAISAAILISYGVLAFEDSADQTERARTVIERGLITDRNGKILASQVRSYDIYVRPPRDKSPEIIDKLAADLAPILETRPEEIRQRINTARSDFIIKKRVSADTYDQIQNSVLPGVYGRAAPFRVYPEKNLASQIIGFVGAQYQGQEGIEYAFNNELSGKETGGKGSKVILTIDANIQYILEKIAGSALKETKAESVMFLAMDPRNGEILGSAIAPGFDPNNHNASDERTYQNLAATTPYEPGSVFKSFSIAALMNSGVISENSEFICNGVYEQILPNGKTEKINCADGIAHGKVRPREIIIHSCNVGAAQAADRQYDDAAFYQSLYDFGFGRKTGAWVNLETAGLLKKPAIWSNRTKQSITFGQEITVSALQIMQAASVIANNGILIPPKIVSRVVSADGKTVTQWENQVNERRQVISPDVAQKMLSYMTDTTTAIGTGWRANVEDLRLAVKTGTAQYRDPTTQGRGYSDTDFIASCVALLPAESPSLILYVVIIKPRGETYGGRIAAPAIREAAEQLIDYLGIPRGRNPIIEHPGRINITEELLPLFGARIPDFQGLSKKTLLPLLLRDDMKVEIRGEGWVKRQSPPVGTPITPETLLILELE